MNLPNFNNIKSLSNIEISNTIIEIEKDNFDKVDEILSKSSIHYDELGIVTEKDIIIDNKSKVTIDELNKSNKNWLIKYMSN